jgi:hypothetical protein
LRDEEGLMRVRLLIAAALAASALTGCVREARMATPADLQARTEQLEISGMGYGERGDFTLGASQGRFARLAMQTGDGFVVDNVGRGSFDIAGPELGGRVTAICGSHERAIDIGALVATRDRLAYGCEFERDQVPLRGGLLLSEVPTSRSLLAGRTRAGELQIGDVRIGIRAIHDMEGGRIPSRTPLGYAFDIDGRQIGAVDLNGGDKTIYAPRTPGAEREAVLMASVALAIFWDPGD